MRLLITLLFAVSLSLIGCDDDASTSTTDDVGTAGSAGSAGMMGAGGSQGGSDGEGGDVGQGGEAGEGGDVGEGGDTGEGGDIGEGGETGEGGEAGEGGESPSPMGPVDTADVLCGVQEEGMQRLVYEQNRRRAEPIAVDVTLPYRYAWDCSEDERTLRANGIPNHGVLGGQFATQLSEQNIEASIPLMPERVESITRMNDPGFALNGVKFDPATAGTCPDDATSDAECSYAMGRGAWQMVATPGETSPWRFGFGVDENDAHVQPNGQYHYHGNPVNLVALLNPDFETSMTLVGWAGDGFPIYSLYGYADAEDANSELVEMRSSYQTVEAPGAGRPSVEDFALGHFEQDWVFVEGSGDLDECNGRFGVTPDFPQGIYHYFITQTYPFVQRCVRGTATSGAVGMGRGRRPGRP